MSYNHGDFCRIKCVVKRNVT